MIYQKAFSELSEDELRAIIVDVYNGKDPYYSNLEGAQAELQRRAAKESTK